MRWRPRLVLSSVTALALMACTADRSAACVSSEVANVCADTSGGGITFSGSGLVPGSVVQMEGPEDASFVLQVGEDGSLDSDSGAVGFLYAFPDVELTFAVSAIDINGEPLEGDIVISS
jgi:hypothetical protein